MAIKGSPRDMKEVAGITPRPEHPVPRRVERIPPRTQPASSCKTMTKAVSCVLAAASIPSAISTVLAHACAQEFWNEAGSPMCSDCWHHLGEKD
jgi:hypothetical protein